MSVTSPFKKAVMDHLQGLADKDPLFAETYAKPNKNIDECLNYIVSEVNKSGHNGFSDEEVFNMAVHYYDEDDIKDVKPMHAKVIVNQSLPKEKSTESKKAAPAVVEQKKAVKKVIPKNQASITF